MVCLDASVSHLTRQLLVLLHQFLVFLVDGQHFTDTVSSRLSLEEDHHSRIHKLRILSVKHKCRSLQSYAVLSK